MTSITDSGLASGLVLNGKYRIESLIGEGGMGAVYKATHTEIGRKVALKTLHSHMSKESSAVQRFHQEAQLAGSIGHDNICEVTDIGKSEDGTPYLVMPLLKGSSLGDIFQRTADPLSVKRILDITCQTLGALEAAHGEGIVHRDLKPDNIFITQIGDREDFVKLLDFGISKVINREAMTQITVTGSVLGTPHYMSPEQARGDRDIDHRVDIYAMGVILYEALAMRPPFNGESYNEIMFKIISHPLMPPRNFNPSIPDGLENIILKAMDREPHNRFNTASEMRELLVQVSSGVPTVLQAQHPELSTHLIVHSEHHTVRDHFSPTVDLAPKKRKKPTVIGLATAVIAIIVTSVIFLRLHSSSPNLLKSSPAMLNNLQPAKLTPALPSSASVKVNDPKSNETKQVIDNIVIKRTLPSSVDTNSAKEEIIEDKQSAPVAKKKTTIKRKQRKSKRDRKKTEKQNMVKGRFRTTFVDAYEE